MASFPTFAAVLAAGLALGCSSNPQSNKSDSTQTSGPDRAGTAGSPGSTTGAPSTPFSFTAYPDEARTDTGRLGAAKSGALVAVSTESPVDLASTWADGPSVVVFYRGFW